MLSWPTTCIWERIDGEYSTKPNDCDTRQMSVHYTALQRDGRQTHQPTKVSTLAWFDKNKQDSIWFDINQQDSVWFDINNPC